MSEENKANLHYANSVVTDDNDFSKGKILDGVSYGLRDYENYLNNSIRVIQKDRAIKIPLKLKEKRYYILFNDFSTEDSEAIKNTIFTKKIKKVLINNSEKAVQISHVSDKEKYIVVKTNTHVNTITLKLSSKSISLSLKMAIVYAVGLDDLKERDAKKVESELFERGVKTVYTEQPGANVRSNKANAVYVKSRNEPEKYIVLDESEEIEYVYLKADDYQLQMQLKAIRNLKNKPRLEHTPLQKLFDLSYKAKSFFEENMEYDNRELKFQILNKPDEFDGTIEQQNFVKKALRTKDFALLEGPPGSGKTTAIIELIIQLIKQNKRVLLVSATHVAVDNVIHRILTTYKEQCQGLVVPIRIASDVDSIRKESVEPYELNSFIDTTKVEIARNIRSKNVKESGKTLLESITKSESSFDDVILKSANLVGGTMIGILKHPDIKKGGIQEMFDVMIVDESSKVTFLDFIVPALYAKKWILVGDVKQLSPYTEDDFINENIDAVIKNKEDKKKLVSAYEVNKKLLSNEIWNKKSVKVLFSKNHNESDFENHEVFKIPSSFENTEANILKLNSVDLVISEPTKKHKKIIANNLFVKAQLFEDKIDEIAFKNRQVSFHKKKKRYNNKSFYPYEFITGKNEEWKELVGSNLSQMYQYRFDPDLNKELANAFDVLVPEVYQENIEKIRRVALPSILELLQIGVGEKSRETKNGERYVEDKLIYKGFNHFSRIKENKFQTLSYQHRMEEEIANLSREHFYNNDNLYTANTVVKRRSPIAWFKSNEDKVIWVTNKDETFRKRNKKGESKNINPTEVKQIISELEQFIKQAKLNPKSNNEKYEIAVLTFYRAQVIELKTELRQLTNQRNKHKFFTTGNVEITLSTVDKFQGDEADMVLLSFTKATKKAFYNSPNRLNVALTRARYKLMLYGNQNWLSRNAQLEALRAIASSVGNIKQIRE
ncbi:AAA domain-containing protein [Oceanihabitans sp. 2_MG-2023]|uniref:AAA domain-containing protein n=1 Tax=Oceanihabitans sp. 2_MG-2023 TaxID=3062661 RepID=UPI0026E2219B|nr:AAA domain-containing protein [Oceanihabitans sp. 2_MG-2023]MDO6597256.1 AAA domain-containing protein [Oceanihabitans sp. 2_MG-2023]